MMKKIISGAIAAVVALSSLTCVFAAQYSSRGSVTVESDIRSSDNTRTASVNRSSKLNITELFSWTAVNEKNASKKKIIITNNAGRVEDGTEHPYIPADVSLRVVNPDAKKKNKYVVGEEITDAESGDGLSVYEYFTLTISNDNGVIYTAQEVPSDTTEIVIPLGLFNYDATKGKTVYSDERTYTVSLQTNSELDRNAVTEYAFPTKWDWYVDVKQEPDYINGPPTPAPTVSAEPEITAAPSAEPSAAPTSEPVEATATPRVKPTTTPRVRPTTTPRPTATPKSASSKTTTAPKATATPKPNPKTGDSAPIAPLTAAGILSLAAIAVIQIKKNKNR